MPILKTIVRPVPVPANPAPLRPATALSRQELRAIVLEMIG